MRGRRFSEECMAVVVDSVEVNIEYFDEAGMDVDGAVDDENSCRADEVFDIGDGRYLIRRSVEPKIIDTQKLDNRSLRGYICWRASFA